MRAADNVYSLPKCIVLFPHSKLLLSSNSLCTDMLMKSTVPPGTKLLTDEELVC